MLTAVLGALVCTCPGQAQVSPTVGLRTEPDGLKLRLDGPSNIQYRVETRSAWGDTNAWQILTNVLVTTPPASLALSNTAGGPMKFYRASLSSNDLTMVWIPPGTFNMGSVTNEVRTNINWQMIPETPLTTVTLTKGFWICKYELTQAAYMAVMTNNLSYFTNGVDPNTAPADRLTYNQASNFCATLSRIERRANRLPEGYTYRLPTEAEWEYACRAGTTNQFFFGDYPNYAFNPTNTPLGNYSWYFKNSRGAPHPVGQKLPNPWGLYDVYGNMCEWVIDRPAPYPGGHVTNYVATTFSNAAGYYFSNMDRTMGVYRSGNWNDIDLRGQRSAARIAGWLNTFWQNLGLRLVLGPTLPGVWTYRGE